MITHGFEKLEWETWNAAETFAVGEELGKKARAGKVIALSGDLGAGKTVFAQGFAKGLGVKETVNSPTFTILKVYESGRIPLIHMDAYRLENESELEAIGGDEYIGGSGVCLIEWPEMIPMLLPDEACWISIDKEPAKGPDYRIISSWEKIDEDTGD